MVVAVLGLLIALAWAASLHPAPEVLPALFAKNPITAAAFIMGGISLWRLAGQHSNPRRDIPAIVLAAVVALLGAMQFGSYFIDSFHTLPFSGLAAVLKQAGLPPLGRMAPNTSLCVLFMGAALLLFRIQTRRQFPPGQALVLASGLIALIALVGHTYGVPSLYQIGGAPMSFVSALCTALVTVGFLTAQPERGLMTVITSKTNGGAMARRLLPAAVLVPWLLGAFLLVGGQQGLYEQQFSVAVFALLSVVSFSGLAFWNATLLYSVDVERVRSEQRLQVQHRATRIVAETPALAEAMPKVLGSICETLGWDFGAMWLLESGATNLRPVEVWVKPSAAWASLADNTRNSVIERGFGVPGRVWATGHPEWVPDLRSEPDCPRAQAAHRAGLSSGFYVPVRLGQEMLGLMEFFSEQPHDADNVLMEMLGSVGTQLGLFVERSRAEEQLRRTTANLERSNTDLEQFAYVASHDLIEPLRAVTSYLQLIKDRYGSRLDAQGTQFIAYAIEGAERMRALINDLLAYSRVDSRGRALESVPSEAALTAALSNLKVAIEENKATISNGSLPVIKADPVQLTQLFQNLVGNGLKFHGTEAPHIEVGAERRDSEWVFHVRDNGIGIDPKYFERIFIIFQRLHTRREYAGTGIGLAICKKIVERHGGRIWVESAPGQGATFFFTLPVVGK